MRKLLIAGATALILALALTVTAIPVGQNDTDAQAFPGESTIEVHGEHVTFGGALQEPEITTVADSITVEGAGATFGGTLQEP